MKEVTELIPNAQIGRAVAKITTVGGYPDDSEKVIEWMCRYKDIPDGYLYTATPLSLSQELKFPTTLRRMWSGTEVQDWIDKKLNSLGEK